MTHAGALHDEELIAAPLAELMAAARARRDACYGRRITYSPKIFVPLTMLCRDRCGYCTFAKAPARLAAPFMSEDDVVALARRGAAAGCHEALFTLGERPELRYPTAAGFLAARGYQSTIEYLAACCRLVVKETGLLPHANAGALDETELAMLRPVTASQGMMLESLAPELQAHRNCPDKSPARRLATLEAAGRLRIAFTTGILVGIGESRLDRLTALRAIADSHRRHGHVQEVIVQNFLPKPGTAMRAEPACPLSEHLWSIAAARMLLPDDVHLQAPPNLTADPSALIEAGIDDFGGVSPVTVDHVNPERAWPELDALERATERAGSVLAPRLAVHPEWSARPADFLDEEMAFAVLDCSDAEGLARDSSWCSGSGIEPPELLNADPPPPLAGNPPPPLEVFTVPPLSPRPRPLHGGNSRADRISEVLAVALAGEAPDEDGIVALFGARGSQLREVAEVA
ncbi:MAG: 7,8-didemethyl-8-hydroxy-5-deazariboflavin synthase CofG, partial [Acidimicrobiales bacterium]